MNRSRWFVENWLIESKVPDPRHNATATAATAHTHTHKYMPPLAYLPTYIHNTTQQNITSHKFIPHTCLPKIVQLVGWLVLFSLFVCLRICCWFCVVYIFLFVSFCFFIDFIWCFFILFRFSSFLCVTIPPLTAFYLIQPKSWLSEFDVVSIYPDFSCNISTFSLFYHHYEPIVYPPAVLPQSRAHRK